MIISLFEGIRRCGWEVFKFAIVVVSCVNKAFFPWIVLKAFPHGGGIVVTFFT